MTDDDDTAIALDNADNVYLTGSMFGIADPFSGSLINHSYISIMKLNLGGDTLLWQNTFSQNGKDDFPVAMTIDSARGCCAGATPAASAVLSALVVKGSFFIVVRLWFDTMPALPGPYPACWACARWMICCC